MWHIQKRYAGASHTVPPSPHPFLAKPEDLPPIEPSNVGRTGYGEIRGELRNIMGGPVEELDTFPEGMGKLEKGMWYHYSLRDDYPPFITTSVEQNQRIWTEMQMEQLMDHHPAHEVHASELPDYHYFQPITNELDHKLSSINKVSELSQQYTADTTDVPRFFRTGVPKLPRHEQDWYIPRLPNGRYDWKTNIQKNGYSASLFDKKGWDRRFLLKLNVPTPPMHTVGWRQWAQMSTYFRVAEAPLPKRIFRQFYASQFDKHVIFMAVYFGSLIMISGTGGHWRQLVWQNDPFNYDICFASENRRKGGFHGII
eukprot:435510_1